MTKTLVSIIGDQAIPNVLMIKEIPADQHLFISTKKMEEKNKSKAIIHSANISEKSVRIIEVIEDDLMDIQKKIENEQSYFENSEIIVNLTGGTKIMSLGVWQYFQDKAQHIFYAPIEKNIYRDLINQNQQTSVSYRVNIQEYLTAYSLTIENFKTDNDILPKFSWQNIQKQPNIFNDMRPFRGKKKLIYDIDRNALNAIGYSPENPNELSKKEIQWLTGDWLEAYVYQKIKPFIPANNLLWGVNIKHPESKQTNELDVLFTYNNALYMLECKTTLKSEEKENILSETVYKLNSLKKQCGLTPKAFLVTLDKNTNHERAKVFDINIIDGNDLENDEKLLGKLRIKT